MELSQKRCIPCEGGVPKLEGDALARLQAKLPEWRVEDEKLHRRFEFESFRRAIDFVNEVAELAEEEGHHPDFAIHYRRVDLILWTHAVSGLTENDFILAAKIDALHGRD